MYVVKIFLLSIAPSLLFSLSSCFSLFACLVAQFCPTLCNPMDGSPPGCSIHGDSPGKNTGVGCRALLQGIFPTQGLTPDLLHCWWILYLWSHQSHKKYWHYLKKKKIILAHHKISHNAEKYKTAMTINIFNYLPEITYGYFRHLSIYIIKIDT